MISIYKSFKKQKIVIKHLNELLKLLGELQLCILQVPSKKKSIFLKIFSAKGSGVVTMSALSTGVSTFGAASTGTAIATLSGAAKVSATMAAIGSVVGGGMAAGGVVLALTGFGAGIVLRNTLGNLWYGKERKALDLSADEIRIRELCSSISYVINEYLKKNNHNTSTKDLETFVKSGLVPLLDLINNAQDDIQENLRIGTRKEFNNINKKIINLSIKIKKDFSVKKPDEYLSLKNAYSYFKSKNINKVEYIHSASVCFTVFIYKILSNTDVSNLTLDYNENLILEAFQRSAKRFEESSIEEIREYITSLEPNQITGWISNAKGIYHELLWTKKENIDGDSLTARLFEETNHAGSDIQFIVDGSVVKEVQFKAVSNPESIAEHFEKYPDIEVYATTEVATKVKDIFENVKDSGFSLDEINKQTNEFIFPENPDMIPDAEAGAAIGLFIAALKNRKGSKSFRNKIKESLKLGTIGASTAVALEYLLFS